MNPFTLIYFLIITLALLIYILWEKVQKIDSFINIITESSLRDLHRKAIDMGNLTVAHKIEAVFNKKGWKL